MPIKLFHDKSTYYVACVKKTQFGAKNKVFDITFFLSSYIDKKVSIFGGTLQKHLNCGYVNEKISIIFFLTFRNMFFG
jgi:hypothetical protein